MDLHCKLLLGICFCMSIIVNSNALPISKSKSLLPHPPTPKVKKDLSRQGQKNTTNAATNPIAHSNLASPGTIVGLDLLHDKEQKNKQKQVSIMGPTGMPIITLYPSSSALSLMPNVTIASGAQGHAESVFNSISQIFSNFFRNHNTNNNKSTGPESPESQIKQQQLQTTALQFLSFLTTLLPQSSKAILPGANIPKPSESVSNPLELPLITDEEIYYPVNLPEKSSFPVQTVPFHKVFPIIFQVGNKHAETRIEFKMDSGSEESEEEEVEKIDEIEGSGNGDSSLGIESDREKSNFETETEGSGNFENFENDEPIQRSETSIKSNKRPVWGYDAPEYRPPAAPKSKINAIVKDVYKIINEITN